MSAVAEKQNLKKAGKFLTFTLGKESFGLEVLKIREIIRMQKITPVPHMPHYAKGIINLRGKVIPVVDMRIKFNVGDDSVSERTCIIVVQVDYEDRDEVVVGLIVDAVEEVANINDSQIEETPEIGLTHENRYIMGIAKIEDQIKTLLDIDRLIVDDMFKQF